jgi:hypothetical protein
MYVFITEILVKSGKSIEKSAAGSGHGLRPIPHGWFVRNFQV